MGWAYMSARPPASRSWTSASWNAFMSLVSGPRSVSMASAVLMRSRMARASSARRIERSGDVVMTWRGDRGGGQVGAGLGLREGGETYAALVALAVVGDEEQVLRSPGGALGGPGRGPLLEHHLAQDAPQGNNGQALGLELDEEDAPGLVGRERAQALDALDLDRRLWVDSELPGRDAGE